MMALEKHSFKPPNPGIYTGVGQDKDSEVFKQRKQEMLDNYALTNILPSTQIQALGVTHDTLVYTLIIAAHVERIDKP